MLPFPVVAATLAAGVVFGLVSQPWICKKLRDLGEKSK